VRRAIAALLLAGALNACTTVVVTDPRVYLEICAP